jgi:tartrate/fumarate subfamily iron-sulfur-dependent hydro-lyase beta chain
VRLYGPVYTARDATHVRLLGAVESEGSLPFGLAGQTLFYAGPTPPAAGRPAGAVGPTTAKRMDRATPRLLEAGIVAMIGKGARSAATRDAYRATGSVYFAAVGGAAALLATFVSQSDVIAWPELGTEALVRMELEGLPVFVAIDSLGGDLYELAPAEWRAYQEGNR